MKRIYQIEILAFLVCLLAACYDDLGNYDYQEVNTVQVQLNKKYGVKKEDVDYVIRPEITQSARKDNSNLRFLWRMSSKNEEWVAIGDTLSFADTAVIHIDTKVSDFKNTYWLRLYVRDTITNATYMYPTTIEIVKPYEGCWTVLHRKDDMTQLGTVEYIKDEVLITEDAYYKESKIRLTGKPVGLGIYKRLEGYSPATAFWCFTDNAEESGILNQNLGFRPHMNMLESVYKIHQENYDASRIIMPQSFEGGPFFISNGKVFQGTLQSPRFYSMFPDANTIFGDYYITHAGSVGPSYVVFDKIGRRFLRCETGRNEYYGLDWDNAEKELARSKSMVSLTKPENVQGVNLDNIGTDKDVVYIGTGFRYGVSMMAGWARVSLYVLVKSNVDNKAWIYDFHGYPLYLQDDPADLAPLAAIIPITAPAGMTVETPCISCVEFNRILFYAVENRVYKLDFGQTGAPSQLVWEHPDPAAKISMLRMARVDDQEYKNKFEEYGFPLSRALGVVVDMPGGTGELVVLHLSLSAKVATDGSRPSVQYHKGFGKIKDIMFI